MDFYYNLLSAIQETWKQVWFSCFGTAKNLSSSNLVAFVAFRSHKVFQAIFILYLTFLQLSLLLIFVFSKNGDHQGWDFLDLLNQCVLENSIFKVDILVFFEDFSNIKDFIIEFYYGICAVNAFSDDQLFQVFQLVVDSLQDSLESFFRFLRFFIFIFLIRLKRREPNFKLKQREWTFSCLLDGCCFRHVLTISQRWVWPFRKLG